MLTDIQYRPSTPTTVVSQAPTSFTIIRPLPQEPTTTTDIFSQNESALPSVIQFSQELGNSITDSDSVASFTESEAGSQVSDQPSNSSIGKHHSTIGSPAKDSVEIRAVHNVSEQHRRKYLKSCFDNLQKEVVTETTAKASHLLIITSALETIQRLREQDFQLKRDQERTSEEQRQLQKRFEEVVRDIVGEDPDFNVNQFLIDADLGNPEGLHSLIPFDRQESFQIEETVEVISPTVSHKRSIAEITEELDSQPAKRSHSRSQTPGSKRGKDGKKGKHR